MLISTFGAEGALLSLLKYSLFAQRTTSQSVRIKQTIHAAPLLLCTPPLSKKTVQISISLASYKDLSMNEGLC